LINVAFAIAFGWVFAEKEATEEKERITAELLRHSQAKALQNQLEPHVLYNALSSLSELVYEDPLAAEDVITRLADLYRMLTVQGKADRIPLGQERKLVEAYLAMEQMRLGERLTVQWDWPAYADEIQAPPLFLQPLVENAIKHGISPSDKGGALVISCNRMGPLVVLIVQNSGQSLKAASPQGVGLSSIEARLALWTEVTADFSLTSVDGWTVAKIQWTPGAKT
jgi:LytS/YehU family sensor histidine kinase